MKKTLACGAPAKPTPVTTEKEVMVEVTDALLAETQGGGRR